MSLQLTKQRIVLEGQSKLNNINTMHSPFVWDFTTFNQDVVESFQSYWQKNTNSHSIHAKQASNPQLSLNFSGQAISTLLHDKLIIHSTKALQGQVKIQIKIDLQDSTFYYLSAIKLSATRNEIDLNKAWQGYKKLAEQVDSLTWGVGIAKVSSLVLIFDNPNAAINIDKIELPYSQTPVLVAQVKIDCSGMTNNILEDRVTHFHLTQKCLLPSNYLWLKNKLARQFPESLLTIAGVKSWQQPKLHQVNKSYTSILMLNTLLYSSLIFFFAIIFWQRKINTVDEIKAKQQPWYQWAAKKMLFKGAKITIKPYHLLINYVVVLVPTILLLMVMAFINFPELQAFKELPLYLLWALVQQFFLVYVLAERIFYNSTKNRLLSALLAASIFSLMHMPSATLMLTTFVGGGLWAYTYLVFKRLLPLALSHAVLALMFYHVVSDKTLYTAKVMQWFWE